MGNILSFFSKEQYLYSFVEAGKIEMCLQYIEKYPELLNKQITNDSRCTVLSRAVWRNNFTLVQALLQKGADPNLVAGRTTPLVTACYRGNSRIAELLIHAGADKLQLTDQNLDCLDYAVLFGNYDVAKMLMTKFNMKLRLSEKDYQQVAFNKNICYVNYELFFKELMKQEQSLQLPDFFTVPPKPKLKDPVLDPNESWIDFIKRVSEFGPPPLVERESLPAELQPQNRLMGKIHFYVEKLKGPTSISLQPKVEQQADNLQSGRRQLGEQP